MDIWRGVLALALSLAVSCGPSGKNPTVPATSAPSARARQETERPLRPEVSATRRPLAPPPPRGSTAEPATVRTWVEVLESPEAGFLFSTFPEESRRAQAQWALAGEFAREFESDHQALFTETVEEVLERFPYGDPMWGPIPGTLGLLLRASPSDHVLDLIEFPDGDVCTEIWSAQRALYAESVQWTGVGRLLYTYVSRATGTRALLEFVHTQPLRAFLGEELIQAVSQGILRSGGDPAHWTDALDLLQSDLEAAGEAVDAYGAYERGTPAWDELAEEASLSYDRANTTMETTRTDLAQHADAVRERMLLAIAVDHPDAYFFAKIAKGKHRLSRF